MSKKNQHSLLSINCFLLPVSASYFSSLSRHLLNVVVWTTAGVLTH